MFRVFKATDPADKIFDGMLITELPPGFLEKCRTKYGTKTKQSGYRYNTHTANLSSPLIKTMVQAADKYCPNPDELLSLALSTLISGYAKIEQNRVKLAENLESLLKSFPKLYEMDLDLTQSLLVQMPKSLIPDDFTNTLIQLDKRREKEMGDKQFESIWKTFRTLCHSMDLPNRRFVYLFLTVMAHSGRFIQAFPMDDLAIRRTLMLPLNTEQLEDAVTQWSEEKAIRALKKKK